MAAKLTPGFRALAMQLQEAATDLTANDIRARLGDAVRDCYKGSGSWAYYVDHIGDAESGDVIYCCDGDTMQAPYAISGTAGAAVCTIDHEKAVDVVPRTIYEVEPEEEDHYAAMEESLKAETLYVSLPVYERFISKKERDAAGSEDFAGKGRSFPILKPEDVMAAVRSIGRAGSGNLGPSGIKNRIIAIAKKKGYAKYLPKSWQGTDTQDSNAARETDISLTLGTLALTESAATLEPIVLREARADYEIRLISPGKGSSAFYPREVLQRDGPKIFKAGTHVYLNHPTAAEESARPEGDVANLAGVLATDAVYHESHPKGEGLYARMKVFQDHAQLVEEKAPHVGMSIRAGGIAEANTKKDGLPVLKELTHAESVDIVTRPGRDGRIFTESALPGSQSQQEADMTAEETKRLIEAETKTYRDALAAANGKLVRSEARDHVAELLEGITLPAATKGRIRDRVMEALPVKENGDLDVEKLRESVAKVAKSEGEYLASITGSGQVTGMGISTRAPLTEAEITAQEAREEREAASHTKLMESTASVFEELGLDKNAAKRAAYKGVN